MAQEDQEKCSTHQQDPSWATRFRQAEVKLAKAQNTQNLSSEAEAYNEIAFLCGC